MAEFKISQLKPFFDRRVCERMSSKQAMQWAQTYAEFGEPARVLKCIKKASRSLEQKGLGLFRSPLLLAKNHRLFSRAYHNKAVNVVWDVREHASFVELAALEKGLDGIRESAAKIGRKEKDYLSSEEIQRLLGIVFRSAKATLIETARTGNAARVLKEISAMRRLAGRYRINSHTHLSRWEEKHVVQLACKKGARELVRASKQPAEMITLDSSISLLHMMRGCGDVDKHADLVARGFAEMAIRIALNDVRDMMKRMMCVCAK